MASLEQDVRQLFAYSVLDRFGRVEDANIDFTFDSADVYLSTFFEAFERLEGSEFSEHNEELAQYARVFERFVYRTEESIARRSAAIMAATLNWMSGYSANSLVIARALQNGAEEGNTASNLLLRFLARDRMLFDERVFGVFPALLRSYITTGNDEALSAVVAEAQKIEAKALDDGDSAEYVSARLLKVVFDRLRHVSLWGSLRNRSSARGEDWTRYMQYQLETSTPLVDLWPSQRTAISKGLLDGSSSLVLRMPTSAGKTKMTELAFVNDLLSDSNRRCLYLAPFRALVTEVESQIGGTLTKLGLPVASLYGGSEANELEVELSMVARVTIATPEKIGAVLKLSGGALSDFGTVVLDEGHLLDSWSRGTSYELQLASLRSQLAQQSRTIFLSAVLPNAEQIASWLGGSTDSLVAENWQPTTMRVGVVTWPDRLAGRLSYIYIAQTGQPLTEQFFVPRILEEDEWREINSRTGRARKHVFPKRGDNGSIAAALAFLAVRTGPVLIYARRPDWAESISAKILERLSLERLIVTNLISPQNENELAELSEYLRSVLGEDSILPQAVAKGFAFHHGGLPQGVRLVIEDEFRRQTIPLLIATNTLAQGVNLPAKTVIVHSLPGSEAPVRDFWNLAGRAGRANKETEGEVLFLLTGDLRQQTVRRFLDKRQMESAESRILVFVRELLSRYPRVSQEAIDALLADEDGGERWSQCVGAIDAHLLEAMVEDLGVDQADVLLEQIVGRLLATHQATLLEADQGDNINQGIGQLFRLRYQSVSSRVPEGVRRKRFARAGISIESCIAIERAAGEISEILARGTDLTPDVFENIMRVACMTRELSDVDLRTLVDLGFDWLNYGSYTRVKDQGGSRFRTLDEAIRFVEETLCYRVPWVLNGVVRIIESLPPWQEEEERVGQQLPDWFKSLSHMMRYGVRSRELVWIMSLGIQDQRLAQWLLDQFTEERIQLPSSLRQLVSWAIASRSEISERMRAEWPKYFVRLYLGILDRYERINTLLTA